MNKNKLGNTDITISPMTMGCWAYGGGEYWGAQSQKDVDDVVHSALDMGVNCFDTAEMYNDGESEKSLGIALKGRRSEAVVISKIKPSNCKDVRKACESGLKRLGTDYLDNYMIHWPINPTAIRFYTKDEKILNDPPTIQDTLYQMEKLKQEGMIRSIGLSNFGITQMQEALNVGVQIDVNELSYNILSRAIESKIVPFALKSNISMVGTMGLQQGLLAGIYETADDVPLNQAHSRHFADERGQGTSRHGMPGAEKEVFEILNQLKVIAKELGLHIAQISIAWVLSKQFMLSTLIGSRSIEELKTNVAACSIKLKPDVVRQIDELSKPLFDMMGDNPDYYENTANSRIF